MTRIISTTEKTVTGLDRSRILHLWEQKIDTYEIARIMKVHESVIYNALASMGDQKTEPYAYPREAAQDRFLSRGGYYP